MVVAVAGLSAALSFVFCAIGVVEVGTCVEASNVMGCEF